jgi:hypothetical protein
MLLDIVKYFLNYFFKVSETPMPLSRTQRTQKRRYGNTKTQSRYRGTQREHKDFLVKQKVHAVNAEH